jgi:KDO2-lipid IV(A) lauroyltransferase
MNLSSVASNPLVVRAGMALSRYAPEKTAHRVFWWLSGVLCRIKPAAYSILTGNLGQVLGPDAGPATLDRTIRQVFDSTLRSHFDLYRTFQWPRERLGGLVDVPEATKDVARSLWKREGGTVLVFPHLGAFDLGGQILAGLLPKIQLLTLPDPPPGFQLANELRRRSGATVTPLSSSALRQAIRHLREGGIVALTGDRPVSDLDEPVPFFDRPARVPSAHVRLALKCGSAVVMTCCVLNRETEKWIIHMEPPLEMIRTGERAEDLRLNMRRVLDTLEAIIRRWPEQWQMFVPVWPALPEA